ncbi:MAG: SLC13 family permease [Acidobacteriota bacterium]|nr:SLC13 family permease [Acidobacteriota bacterium]
MCALLLAIAVSCTSRINVGLLAIPLAWGVGVYAGRPADAVLAGFPSALFVTLAGVTVLFTLAEINGTVGLLARRLLGLARGRHALVPPLIFLIACAISTVGPGAIVSVALVAPVGMALSTRAGIPPFLTALMIANGANAGNLSPLSAVGIIANTRMASVGLGGHEWKVWAANFLAHCLVGAAAYALLIRTAHAAEPSTPDPHDDHLTGPQWLTLAAIVAWIAGVVGFGLPIGLSAFAAAAIVVMAAASDETAAIRRMPWAAIVMVCGVTMLVALVEKTGGMDVFTSLLAKLARPSTINGVIALVTGLISTYSSTSAVVLPTFLPTVPGLVQQVGGGNPLAVALSINVGASIVDVSPFSTLGALCVAAVAEPDLARDLFRKLMIWGFSMAAVGAVLCQVFANAFAG